MTKENRLAIFFMFVHFKNKTNLILFSIVLLGGIVRFMGVNPGFNQFHSDEGISYSAAVSMIKDGNLDPLRYDYPALVPEINYLAFKGFFIPISWGKYYLSHLPRMLDGLEAFIPQKDEYKRIFQHDILGDREVHALFWGRYTTAFISTLSIVLVFLLGNRLVNKKVGLYAAFLLAVNFRSVTNSHIGLPDTYNAFFVLLSLLLSYRILKHKSALSYLLAGIGIGLSLATKYQTFIVFPFLFIHFCTTPQFYTPKRFLKLLFDKRLFISGLTAACLFIALNPYFLIHFEQGMAWIVSVSGKYAMGRDMLNLFPIHYWLSVDYGVLLFFFCLTGGLLLLKKQPVSALFLLFEIAPFLFVMLYYSIGGFYVRNFITITPIFLLFAAYVLWSIERLFVFRRLPKIAVLGLLLVVALHSMRNVFIHTTQYMRPWNYQAILDVSDTVIPEKSIVVGHPFDPLPPQKIVQRIPISTATLYSLGEIEKVNADFAYINLDWAADPFYGWMTRGFPENASYVLNKPYKQMRETFWGLSIEEMMHFVVGSVYKPWQAPEADLFIIKVPKFPAVDFKPFIAGSFTSNSDIWEKGDENDANSSFLSYNSEKNALQIGPGSGTFNIARFMTKQFPIRPGHLYKITGSLHSDAEIQSEKRNVFLRADFMDEKGNRVFTAVSERFWGIKGKLEFISQAPQEARFVSIGLESTNALSQAVYLETYTVLESKDSVPYSNVEHIPYSTYKDILYPNSHGNL